MNSRMTLVLAGVLLAGAVVTGYWGLSLSREPVMESAPSSTIAPMSPAGQVGTQLQAQVDEQQRTNVVVLAREVPPLVPITRDDLAVERLRLAPPGSFSNPDDLVGRSVWRQTPAGTVLNQAAFDMGGPLAKMIRAQERAIAVAVDEVIGGGGHLSPGDYVDVLLYLRQDERNNDQTAQVLIPALRLLSVGDALGVTNQGDAAQSPLGADDNRRRRPPTTAVLAVPEQLLTRFMLATQVGSLRLAVRSADEQLLAGYYAGDELDADIAEAQRQLFQFEKLAQRSAEPRPQPQLQSGVTSPSVPSIQVYRGNDATRQIP